MQDFLAVQYYSTEMIFNFCTNRKNRKVEEKNKSPGNLVRREVSRGGGS